MLLPASKYKSLKEIVNEWSAQTGELHPVTLRRICDWAISGGFPDGTFVFPTGQTIDLLDRSRPSSGVPADEGLPSSRSGSAGFAETGPAEQPLLPCGCTRYGDCDHPGTLCGFRTDAGGGEADGASRHLPGTRDGSPMDDRRGSVEGSPCPIEACASTALPARLLGRADPDRWIGALVVRGSRAPLDTPFLI